MIPSSVAAEVPQAAWSIFKCQPLQASSTMREEVTAREVPGLCVLEGLCGHWQEGSWPLTHETGKNTTMGTSQPEPHENFYRENKTCHAENRFLSHNCCLQTCWQSIIIV